ncbi:hypothetical protein [Leptolyngbya sp. FACHB-261]|uniref:hypothetical protein n=1 Tax=Leptolyngbya sp. FACHB-261 TaxID=2692806 RepID=UPI001683D78D|nr:hypothetical protein [Leptolyngbya sp. FACHB-261]MBD2103145.1 hypothetical protein [Leptolyngbya sp. FACHB-261]
MTQQPSTSRPEASPQANLQVNTQLPNVSSGSTRMVKPTDEAVGALRQADQSLYNQMALEIWSLLKTTDNSTPGFWNRFMHNRQAGLKQFLDQKSRPADIPEPGTHEPEQSEPSYSEPASAQLDAQGENLPNQH